MRNADISIPRFNTVTYGKHSLRYLGAKLWSKLDAGVKSSVTLEIFKSKIAEFILGTGNSSYTGNSSVKTRLNMNLGTDKFEFKTSFPSR